MKPTLRLSHATLVILLLSWLPQPATADVRLPGFFGDHMVMQRDSELRIWGWCDAGEEVSVTLNGKQASTKGRTDGTWKVTLPAMEANSKPLTLQVKGNNVIIINDVLIGEVWLCSGQSNMEWTVAASTNRDAEIAAADYPLIRHLKIGAPAIDGSSGRCGRPLDRVFTNRCGNLHGSGVLHGKETAPGTRSTNWTDQLFVGWHESRTVDSTGWLQRSSRP